MTRRLSKVLLLVWVLAPACASENVPIPRAAPVHWTASAPQAAPSPVVPTQRERALAQAYAAAMASPQFAALGPLLDDDARFVFGAHDKRGRAGVIKEFDDLFGGFDNRRLLTRRCWLTDSTQPINAQAIEWTMTGVQMRTSLGVAPTGKPVTIHGLTLLWTTDDGIISEGHVYFDEDVVKAQLGAGPVALRHLTTPAAPTGPAQVLERTGAAEEKANVATFRAMLQALEDNQESAYLATMTEDVSLFTLDAGEPVRGQGEARSYFKTVRKAIRQVDTVVENAWGVGSFAIVEYSITGLQVAPLPRIAVPAGGALHPLYARFADVAEIHGGKIARIWRYSDPVSFASL